MKTAVQSKTVVFNVLSVILAGLMFFTNVVPEGINKDLVIAVIGVINVLLRFRTFQPITLR